MAVHHLKVWPEYYEPFARGVKKFELRAEDDRTFVEGDILCLREWEPMGSKFTGRMCYQRITFVLRGGPWLRPGYAALSIEELHNEVDQ